MVCPGKTKQQRPFRWSPLANSDPWQQVSLLLCGSLAREISVKSVRGDCLLTKLSSSSPFWKGKGTVEKKYKISLDIVWEKAKRTYLNLYLSLSNFVLLDHVPFRWGTLTHCGRPPSGSQTTEPLLALSQLSSRVWAYFELDGTGGQRGLWGYLAPASLPREAFPQGVVGKPAFRCLAQSEVFTTNIAKAVRSCLFFQIKLYPSVLEKLWLCWGGSEMSSVYLLGQKCSVDTANVSPTSGQHTSTLVLW